jgi:hypothetical protein
MAANCDHPAPDVLMVGPRQDGPRPGWYLVRIGSDRARGDVLEVVRPFLAMSETETGGQPAQAVLLGDRADEDCACGYTWTEVQVRPAEPDEPQDDVLTEA